MASQPFSCNDTSSALEKEAIARYRQLMICIPPSVEIHRNVWGSSTVLCLDFERSPQALDHLMEQAFLLLLGAHFLGLSHSIMFRIGAQTKGWLTMIPH